MDINTPVANPMLLMALADNAVNDTPYSRRILTEQLLQATFLVAIIAPDVLEETDNDAGQTTWQAGSSFSVLLSGDGQGGQRLPLFTDWDTLRKWTDEPVSGLVMTADEAWVFALADKLYAGVVINPSTDRLVLSPAVLEQLASHSA